MMKKFVSFLCVKQTFDTLKKVVQLFWKTFYTGFQLREKMFTAAMTHIPVNGALLSLARILEN